MKSGPRALTQWISRSFVWAIVLGLILTVGGPTTVLARVDERHPVTKATLAKVPLSFEANRGQTDSRVDFLARGAGYTLFLTGNEAVLALRQPQTDAGASSRAAVLRLQILGAQPHPRVEALDERRGKANYFIGKDPAKWRTGVPTYAKVRYRDVYPGIDLVYYGNQGQLEYDFVVAPGANPEIIRLSFDGADDAELDDGGDLVVHVRGSRVHLRKPVIYQEIDGVKQPVAGGYVLRPASSFGQEEGEGGRNYQVGFQIAAYDTARALVIDPVLVYSTYLGGSGIEDACSFGRQAGIAVDLTGHAYVTGCTASADFPGPGGVSPAPKVGTGPEGTGFDAYVVKLNANGSELEYSTYLGGTSYDAGRAIAVHAATGTACVTGVTWFPAFSGFPTTAPPPVQPFQATTSAPGAAFVSCFDQTGMLRYSTFLSGSADSQGGGIAIHASGLIYVTGRVDNDNFPTTPSAFQPQRAGIVDAFVTVLDPTPPVCTMNADISCQEALVYSTYLGGFADDEGEGIAADVSGNALVTGRTNSFEIPGVTEGFPTKNAFKPQNAAGGREAFVAKINPFESGDASLVYSTYLGGDCNADNDTVGDGGIAVDLAGNAYVTGRTCSTDFPGAGMTAPSLGPGGSDDAFVATFGPLGQLLYATRVGGSGQDHGTGIAVDLQGRVYVTGYTLSSDFPGPGGGIAPKEGPGVRGDGQDVFVAMINPSSSGSAQLVDAMYLGGTKGDFAYSIAIGPGGAGSTPGAVAIGPCGDGIDAYVTGYTGAITSPEFPTTAGAFQETPGGNGDAFVAKVRFGSSAGAPFCHPPLAYITHEHDTFVSVIDTTTNAVIANAELGKTSWGVATHPDGTRVYVSNFIGNTVSVIDATTNTKVTEVAVGPFPIGVAVHPSGAWVYVANSGVDPVLPVHTISVIRTADNTVIDTVTLPIAAPPAPPFPAAANVPFGIAVHPDGTRVYVTNQQGNFVTVIDVDYTTSPGISAPTHTPFTNVSVAAAPRGIAAAPDGSKVYVTSDDPIGPIVSVIDTATLAVGTIPGFKDHSYAVATHPDPGEDKFYVTAQAPDPAFDVLWAADLSPFTLKDVTVGRLPRGVSVSPWGTHAYVAQFQDNSVSVVDTATNARIDVDPFTPGLQDIKVGMGPIAFGDRFVGAPDLDGDGIVDFVDVNPTGLVDQSLVPSSLFTDKHLGFNSEGVIVDRADLTVSAYDAFGNGLWVRASGGGSGTATVHGCNNPADIDLTNGDVVSIHCSDVTVTVMTGPIEIRLAATTMVSVPTFGSIRVSETGGVQNIGPVAIVVESNGQQTIVGPGGSFRGDPAAATEQLIAAVRTLNLQAGTARSLVAILETVVAKLGVGPTPFHLAAVNSLGAFINAVEAQRGKKIARADADALIAAAEQIVAELTTR